jgi:hypothetical protein
VETEKDIAELSLNPLLGDVSDRGDRSAARKTLISTQDLPSVRLTTSEGSACSQMCSRERETVYTYQWVGCVGSL